MLWALLVKVYEESVDCMITHGRGKPTVNCIRWAALQVVWVMLNVVLSLI